MIRGKPWNLAAERCRIERITRCILRIPVMKWIIRILGLTMERITSQVYIFFHFALSFLHNFCSPFFSPPLRGKKKHGRSLFFLSFLFLPLSPSLPLSLSLSLSLFLPPSLPPYHPHIMDRGEGYCEQKFHGVLTNSLILTTP